MHRAPPASNHDFDLMTRHLSDVTVELFAAYDVTIEPCSATTCGPESETYCMASIGYVGDGVRGALVLAAPQAVAEAWTQAAGGAECDFADTLGEFSNMLLGRLKGRLLCEGITIGLATPMTVTGGGLRFSLAPGQSSWQFFQGRGWRLGTRLDAAFEAGFERRTTTDDAQPADAGDAILF